MLILKRLSIWFLETVLEVTLLGMALPISLGGTRHDYVKDFAVSFVLIGVMFFSTGYLLTTGIARAVWQPLKAWLSSLLAVLLFAVHFEILNHEVGGMFDPPKRTAIGVAGACIVIVSTFVGSLLLRRWTAASASTHGTQSER